MQLTSQQEAAILALLDGARSGKLLQTLGGYAGTGKTVVVSHLHESLPRFAVCAFTGKAADILRRKGIDTAKTIHSTIYTPKTRAFYTGKVWIERVVGYELRSKDELSCNGFLIDEASMVGADVFRDLQSFGLPIIAVGDHGQLPPVGEDVGLMQNPDYRLEEIHRNAGPIAFFADHLRQGGNASQWSGEGAVHVVNDIGHAEQYDQTICGMNRTRVILNKAAKLRQGKDFDKRPSVGDRVMCLKNHRQLGVFNGQQGVASEVYENQFSFLPTYPENAEPILIRDDPASWLCYVVSQDRSGHVVPFDYAWAITAHKSQGDEWDTVAVVEEKCPYWDPRRWAYTAASRAKKALVWRPAA